MTEDYIDRHSISASKRKFFRKARTRLLAALEEGKRLGNVSPRASLRVGVDPDTDYLGYVYSDMSEEDSDKRAPKYRAGLGLKTLGDWNAVEHEATHIMLGDPEVWSSSVSLKEEGDFLKGLERELRTCLKARRTNKTLDELYYDIADEAYGLVRDYGLEPETAFELTKTAAREVGIPYQYIKKAREYLDEES